MLKQEPAVKFSEVLLLFRFHVLSAIRKDYEIDRKRIHITDDVKELGTYKANIDFGNGNTTEVEFEVAGE